MSAAVAPLPADESAWASRELVKADDAVGAKRQQDAVVLGPPTKMQDAPPAAGAAYDPSLMGTFAAKRLGKQWKVSPHDPLCVPIVFTVFLLHPLPLPAGRTTLHLCGLRAVHVVRLVSRSGRRRLW